jgi:signal transduction histidine kinase
MRRLHLQIFGALVATGLLCVGVAVLLGSLLGDDTHPAPHFVRNVGALVVEGLPEADADRFQRALRRRAQRLHASISIWDQRGRLLGRAGRALSRPQGLTPARDVLVHKNDALWLGLEDGRTLAVSFHGQRSWFRPHGFGFAVAVLALVLVLLAGSYFAARRITRRLELLEQGVTRFGEGDLGVRVREEGRDEVAQLARAFNRSFARISGLLRQQRRMLQSASHELRSPLARLRMALELLTEPESSATERARLSATAERDIAELDLLISDLLLAGRLTDSELPKDFAPVLVGALLREEAVRAGAEIDAGEACDGLCVFGNPRMLKSLVRNLFENAKRYGRDPVRASLACQGPEVVLWIDDQGAPVPETDRERIFEPFYRPQGHHEGKDGGVGLGLHLVRSIAEHHGGTVRYLVHDGHSRFEVRLPLAAPPSKESG